MARSSLHPSLVREISRAFENLGASADLLAAINSIGDTMTDEEIAVLLKSYNDTGTFWRKVHATIPEREK